MLLLPLATILSTSFALLPLSSEASSVSTSVPFTFQHVSVISTEQLQDLIQSGNISIVYFYVKDSQNIGEFLEEYEMSARYLKVYNITLALYNCSSDVSDHEMCGKEKVEHNIYTYQDGVELLTLTLETMFDVNSIMANALQLALLHQVPILQSRQELYELQRSLLGKLDLLCLYLRVSGTEEHRIFLEVAYAFQDHFKFALTTEFRVAQGLQKSEHLKTDVHFAMFVLFCSESTPAIKMSVDGLCYKILYQGEVTFTAVAHFVKSLTEKTLYYAPADGSREVFDMTDDLPIIFVYIDKEVQDQAMPVVELIKFEHRSIAKVIVVDMDDHQCRLLAVQQGLAGKLPIIGIKRKGVMTFSDKFHELSADNIRELIMTSGIKIDPTLDKHNRFSILIDDVQRQDDQIAQAVTGLQQEKMELDHVPALLKHNFYKTVMNADLKLVLFYIPFDHMSMAFLREFGHAAETLAKNLSEPDVMAQVNCYDGTDLCTAESITTYPLTRIYRKGQGSQNYLGSLDSRSVIKAVKLLRLNSPVQLENKEEVQQFFNGQHHTQSFYNFTPSSVLLLISKKDTNEEQIFNNVAKSLSTITAFGVVHGDVASSIAEVYNLPVPSVMALHRNDRNKPIRSLNEPLSELSLTDFVKSSIISSLPELTVMNLPTLFARKQPFAILFLDSSDSKSRDAKIIFTKIAMFGQINNIIFCWMNAQAKTMGHRIMSDYTWKATVPMITVVDHERGELFNFQPEELKLEDTSEWLARVLARKVQPSKMLEYAKWLPPGPHFDFLALIDKLEGTYQNDENFGNKHCLPKESSDPYSQGTQTAENVREEALKIDSELREELLELQKSRIYHKSPDRSDGNRNHHLRDQESSSSHTHPHVEL